METSQNLLSKLSTNISIQSLNPANPSSSPSIQSPRTNTPNIGDRTIQNLPAGISVFSVDQDSPKTANAPELIDQNVSNMNKTEISAEELWKKFEQFKKWHENVASSSPTPINNNNDNVKKIQVSSESGPPVVRPLSMKINRTTLSATDKIRPNKTSLQLSSNKLKQRSLPYQQGCVQPWVASQSLILSNQTLNQPLNPNVFLPGALKCFSKSRAQMANVQNLRRYPQLSNESLRRQAATFMAAPSPEILAEMREEGFPKDFQVENCRSSSEYLHCLLGFGLHQTLNFPVMGVFYLELVRLIMKHLDRFSSNEKVKLIQVSNVCEDILRQNSTRDDFLPVEVMDKIIDEAVKEEHKIQKMIEDFHGDQILENGLSNESNVNKNTDIS